MAEESDSGSKTEEPTARKLEQAKEKGDVVKTQDLPHLTSFAAAAASIALFGGWMSRNMAEGLRPFLEHPDSIQLQGGGGVEVARHALMAGAPFIIIVLAAASFAGVGGHLVQTGLLWTPDRLKFDFNKVSPLSGFKKLFGVDALIQFFKSLLKAILPYVIEILKKLAFAIGAFMLVITGADWFIQRQRFMTRQKMSKEEVKEDYKQTEGDPHIKGRQRALRMQRARRRMMSAVPTATVVVMNPTHYAVALKYEEGAGAAPQCVAKGMDAIALRIRAVAEEAGVPVIEDAPLARALYASIEIEDFIPVAHYEAVAKIIGFVLGGKGKRAAS
jgi:flagellar biosynthetic protein FlhB